MRQLALAWSHALCPEMTGHELPVPDLCADGMKNACELLMRGCLHVIAQEDPKMFDGLLACDEADAGEGSY